MLALKIIPLTHHATSNPEKEYITHMLYKKLFLKNN